jgi:GT2 family glycosyltransferase
MGSGLYPTHLVRSIGGFREDLRGAEDFDFNIRLFLAGAKFRAIPEMLNTYCRHGGITFTETNLSRFNSDWLRLFKDYLSTLPQDHRPLIAKLLMEHAYRLFANGQYRESQEAIALATSNGQSTVTSSSALLRRLSYWIGIVPVFHLRKIRALLPRALK